MEKSSLKLSDIFTFLRSVSQFLEDQTLASKTDNLLKLLADFYQIDANKWKIISDYSKKYQTK